MGTEPILPVKRSISIDTMLNFDRNGDGHGTCKHTFKVTVFVSGTFDLFNVMCKQYHKNVFNPFLNGMKNSDPNGTCENTLTRIYGTLN